MKVNVKRVLIIGTVCLLAAGLYQALPLITTQGHGDRVVQLIPSQEIESLKVNGTPIHRGWAGIIYFRYSGSTVTVEVKTKKGGWSDTFTIPADGETYFRIGTNRTASYLFS